MGVSGELTLCLVALVSDLACAWANTPEVFSCLGNYLGGDSVLYVYCCGKGCWPRFENKKKYINTSRDFGFTAVVTLVGAKGV